MTIFYTLIILLFIIQLYIKNINNQAYIIIIVILIALICLFYIFIFKTMKAIFINLEKEISVNLIF